MTALVYYFQVHQPYRIRPTGARGVGPFELFDEGLNELVAQRVAERCYLPMNAMLLRAIEEHEGRFRCAFSLSGTALRQFGEWCPEVLESFQALAATGCVEMLCETSMHSLAALGDVVEWKAQIEEQAERIERLFGERPTTFRNTELITSSDIARGVESLGFSTMVAEGADTLLEGLSPRHPFRPAGCEQLTLLLRDYRLSDDIAFRFSNTRWEAYPLFAETFAEWLGHLPEGERLVGLFMDYETFGEHQPVETGIIDFMEELPRRLRQVLLPDGRERYRFQTPAETVLELDEERVPLTITRPYSWADEERDLSAWLANPMQRDAHLRLYDLLPRAREAAAAGNAEALEAWRYLSTSDHVYYMATKNLSDDADVHSYFSPYGSPWEAYVNFVEVLDEWEACAS